MKTNNEHTPGPWKIVGRLIEGASKRWGGSTSRVRIAVMENHRFGACDHVCPDDIQEANARLIAAAPELLAALEDVLVWQETFERGECRKADLQDAIKEARAIITKVRY